MKRRFLILAFILCFVSIIALMSSCDKATEGLEFVDISDTECGVKCGEAVNETEIVIPNKYNGKKVTTIMSTAFSKCDKLVSITIPKSITKVEKGAFYNCTSLENVYYKGKVKDWCKIDFAMGNSSPMDHGKNFYAKGKEITSLNLKDIDVIKPYAFFSFDNLESLKADNNLISIGENAFAGCSKLSSVILPSSIVSLDKLCFSSCTKLKEIVIPANASQMHMLAFYDSGLNTVTFENTEKWFTTNNKDATRGDKYDVTDPEMNAYRLVRQGSGYLKRALPTA
jgi:hypothetical protein